MKFNHRWKYGLFSFLHLDNPTVYLSGNRRLFSECICAINKGGHEKSAFANMRKVKGAGQLCYCAGLNGPSFWLPS